MLAPDNILESLQNILTIKKKGPKISTELYAWENLTRLEEDLKLYENAQKQFTKLQAHYYPTTIANITHLR
jgi:hypothetical protein